MLGWALSQLAWAHAHETLLWASKGKGARHTFNYHLLNGPDPDSQIGDDEVAAKELGRLFVGTEKEREYAELAGRRIGAAKGGGILGQIRAIGGRAARR